jgi:hypothetical protein
MIANHAAKALTVILLFSAATLSCAPLAEPGPCPNPVDSPVDDISVLLASPPDFSYDFEAGWNATDGSGDLANANSAADPWRYAHMQRADAGQVVADPQDGSNKVMQFTWQEGAGTEYDSNTQKKAHLYGDFGATPHEEEVWSFDVFYPSSGMESDSEGEIIIQFHGVPDGCETYRNPPISLDNHNNEITLTWRYDPRECTPAGFTAWDARVVEFGATPKDQWVTYVFHIRYSPDGCGLLRVWQDGVLKVNETGIPIGFADQQGAYLGFGLYKWSNNSSLATERRVLFDNVRKWEISY